MGHISGLSRAKGFSLSSDMAVWLARSSAPSHEADCNQLESMTVACAVA